MASPSSARTGILVVRLWIEANAQEGFRARIVRTLDAEGTDQETATAATPGDLYTLVQTWVEEFVAGRGAVERLPGVAGPRVTGEGGGERDARARPVP